MKKEKIMNLDEIKNISIKSYLESINCKPISEKGHYGMYIAPYRNDSKESLRVNYNDNLFYDHGLGKGGSIIDLVMRIYKCKFKEALTLFENGIIEPNSFSFHREEFVKRPSMITIKKIKSLENVALLEYLTSRKIDISVAKCYCDEIYYEVDAKSYFAIGFKNLSDGYELRSKYFKGCTQKDISVILGDTTKPICIFEGFIDFLSYASLNKNSDRGCIILNSLANIPKLEKHLKEDDRLELYLDNDLAGDKASDYLYHTYDAKDMRNLYGNYEDLNDYLNG